MIGVIENRKREYLRAEGKIVSESDRDKEKNRPGEGMARIVHTLEK
jgi:hypothetical protein